MLLSLDSHTVAVTFVFRWNNAFDPEWMFGTWSTDAELVRWDYICMMIGYFVWQMFYWVKVEMMDKTKLKRNRDLVTSARWLGEVKPHPFYLKIKKAVPFAQPELTLIVVQLIYTGITLFFIPYMYYSKAVHVFFIALNLLSASWLGASFYFESFARAYTSRLQAEVDAYRSSKELKENEVITRYCPNTQRSFWIFAVYFSSSIIVMFLSFRLTIWL